MLFVLLIIVLAAKLMWCWFQSRWYKRNSNTILLWFHFILFIYDLFYKLLIMGISIAGHFFGFLFLAFHDPRYPCKEISNRQCFVGPLPHFSKKKILAELHAYAYGLFNKLVCMYVCKCMQNILLGEYLIDLSKMESIVPVRTNYRS